MPTIRSKGEALRGTSPPIPLGFSRHSSGVPRHLEILRSFGKISSPGETESGSAGTQPDEGYPGRRCAHGTAGPWRKTLPGATLLWSNGTPEPCLKKSIPEGKPGPTLTHRFSRRAYYYSVLIWICGLALGLTTTGRAQESLPANLVLAGMEPERAERLSRYVRGKMEELHSPGLAVGVVEGSTLVLAGYFGWADLEAKKPVDETTLFRIGSISKTFTALGLMQQWEQGRFQLDDNIADYLPQPLIFPPHPETQPVTFRHLLTHTSGGGEFLAYKQVLMKGQGVTVAGEDYLPLERYLELGMKTQVDPGRKWAYCNYGFAFLGLALEQISGEPFHRYQQKHVFEPLGMTHTFFHHDQAVLAQTATGYKFREGRYQVDSPKMTGITPAGNLFTNLNDMALYVIALLNGGRNPNGAVLKPETLAMIMQTQFTLDERQAGWGLGFQVYGDNLWGRRVIGHAGSIPFGFTAQMLLVPEERVGVLVFSNSGTYSPGVIGWGVLKLALDIREEPLPEVEPDRAVWPELYGYYGPEHRDFKTSTRLYMSSIGTFRVAERDDHLVLISTWQGKKKAKVLRQLSADDPYFYWMEDEKSELPRWVAFQKGDQGRIYLAPGGLNEYLRLGPGRALKARLMKGPGRVLARVNPF